MHIYRNTLFRIFQSDFRDALQRFFENRHTPITREIALGFVDVGDLERLVALQILEHDAEEGVYRLDDRLERFLDEMLGAAEVARADWLVGLLEELRRLIEGHQKLANARKGEDLLRRICRILRNCLSRIQRHLEEIKAAADYDYRAGSDYEVKLMKLGWHLDRSRSYGHAVSELNNLLRHDAFFQVHHEFELVALRGRLVLTCGRVGNSLIDVYQCIEEYLNRVVRDYDRARKLIHLRGLIERREHLPNTNLADLATVAQGPWFHELRFRTALLPSLLDERPDLLDRVMARAGLAGRKAPGVMLEEHQLEELPPVIDWSNIFASFAKQSRDLFSFLETVRIEGRPLTQEQRIDGYCAILSNEGSTTAWNDRPFQVAATTGWEYAIINPPIPKL